MNDIMETRILEVNVVSAEVFDDVNVFSQTTDAYVVVLINGDHRSSERTPIGRVRGSGCYWNHTMKFIGETAVRSLVFHLNSERRPEDEGIAAVEIPFDEELFHGYDENVTVAHPFVAGFRNGEIEGVLNFTCTFRDGYWKPLRSPVIMYPPTTYHMSAMAYPLPYPWWSFGYPCLPPCCGGYPAYEYRQPPFQGYGYGYGYGYEFYGVDHDDEEDDAEEDYEDDVEQDDEDYYDGLI